MLCAICYHSHNFKKVKNTHKGALVLVKLASTATLLLVTLSMGVFQFLKIVQVVPNRVKRFICKGGKSCLLSTAIYCYFRMKAPGVDY